MFRQILLYFVRISSRFVDFVDRYDDRNPCRFGVADGFYGLRLNAVISRNDENRDIGYMSSSGAHSGKGFVSRSIQEYDLLSVDSHLGSADMLRNSTRLRSRHVGLSYGVKQGSLSVVDVTHDGNNRRSRAQILFVILEKFKSFFFQFFFHVSDGNLNTQLLRQNHNRIFIDVLIDIGHNTQFHQCHDDLGS